MTRLVFRKSLLVLGLLVAVLGSGAAAAFATARPADPTATADRVTAARPAAGHRPAPASPVTASPVTASPVTAPAITTAYRQAAQATGSDPQTSTPGLEPAGICSVPGIGSIGSLLGFCSSGAQDNGILGGLNSICSPSLPEPESADGGIDSIVRPPGSAGSQGRTLYDNYGVAGQFWAAYGLQCSDMTSLIGNNVAGMVFDAAKAVDRVTITVYQSAAGNGILSWLASVVNRLISSLGNAIYFPYLAPVVLLGVIWLAWNGLVRKRASRTIEGTIWMVVACAAAIWLIGRPADFTGFGQSVSNGVTQVLNVAFSKLPGPGEPSCVPVAAGDPQSPGRGDYGFTQGNGMVDANANELWTVLVCQPWLDGEFGTSEYSAGKAGQTPVNAYGRQLLWAQAIAANETPSAALIQAKQDTYAGIASSIKQNDPAVYPLFQGNQWTSRLEIGFAALFAALIAGVLILLIAVTLIILKLGFLLLLIAGPFFLIVGTHPGFGRVVAVRWVEMIIGVLLKQVAVALVLSVLLYAYSLIMGTSDAVLPWALKILMIALVTIAVFIYRKPFQHLFSAVGYSTERRERRVDKSREMFRVSTLTAAAAASGFAGARLGRWSRRDAQDAAALADSIAAAHGVAADPDLAAGQRSTLAAAAGTEHGPADPQAGGDGDGQLARAGARASAGGNGRAGTAADVDTASRAAPPLHLPSRQAANGEGASGARSGWARGGVEGTGAGRPQARAGDAPPRTVTPSGATIGAGSARSALPQARPPSASPRSAPPPPRQAPSPVSRPGSQAPQRQAAPPPVSSPVSRPVSSSASWAAASSAPRPVSSAAPPPARQAPPGPAPPRPAPPRPAAGGPAPVSSGGSGPRARWRDEAPSRPAPERRGGRPLWQPGPIRSAGWSGGSGAGSAPPAAAPSPAAPPAAAPPAAAPPAAAPPAPPYSGPAHASQHGASSSHPSYRSGRPRGAPPATSPPGGVQPGTSQAGHERPGPPLPFWLRPVRRKK